MIPTGKKYKELPSSLKRNKKKSYEKERKSPRSANQPVAPEYKDKVNTPITTPI
jgi:hypothetical protein